MFTRHFTLALSLSLACGLAVACSDNSSVQPNQQKSDSTNYTGDTTHALGDEFALGPVEPLDSTVISADTSSEVDTVNSQINTTQWVTQQIHFSAKDNPEQFMQFDPNAGVLWPGNVVMGNTVAEGSPSEFPIAGHRQPITVYLDVVSGDSSGTANHFSRLIPNPVGSAVTDSMNSILAGYKGSSPARFTYTAQAVYSSSQLAFQLGLGYSGPAVTADAHFQFANSNATSRYTVRLTQEYFTMTMDPIFGLHGAWDSSIGAADVAPYAGSGSPVAYIGSVTYGRVYWLTYESTASESDLQAAISLAYSGGVASGSTNDSLQYDQVMQNTTVTVTAIGGDAGAALATAAKDYGSIRAFLANGAQFSPSSPGAPISYKVRYLEDGTLMKLNSTMDYTVTEKIPLSSALSYTSSDLSLYADNFSSWGSIWSDQGGLRFALFEINTATGDERLLWGEPCTFGCGAGQFNSYKIDYVPWNQTDSPNPVNLNWSLPTYTYENKPGIELAVQCGAINYEGDDDNPTTGYDRIIFGYDADSQHWIFMNPNGNGRNSTSCQATDSKGRITVLVNFSMKANGQLIQ